MNCSSLVKDLGRGRHETDKPEVSNDNCFCFRFRNHYELHKGGTYDSEKTDYNTLGHILNSFFDGPRWY